MKRHRRHTHRVRKRISPLLSAVPVTDDIVVENQPKASFHIGINGSDITSQRQGKFLPQIIECVQPDACSDIDPAILIPNQLAVISRKTIRAGHGHILERMSVEHKQGIRAAEPYPTDGVFDDTVNASVIGGFRHLMETIIPDVDGIR